MNNPNVLQCAGLTKSYKNVLALNNFSINLPRGQIIGLLGPNGSGKTTFIKIACGLLAPTGGAITINGMPVGPETKARVSYLPDKDFLPDWMLVKDAINFFCDYYADFDSQRAIAMLTSLQIQPNALIKTLSKGTKEKVQLVLAMSRNADLFLLDEPIAGVDPASRDFILRTIIQNYRPEATVVISTHLIADIEPVLDSFIFISYGQLAMMSSVDDMRSQKGMSVDQLFREVYRC